MNFLFKALVAAYLFLTASCLFGQETIKMKKQGGVYTIPCEVNGLRLRFIFDTGASDVSISSTEALFMLKNGYLDANDLLGSTEYQIANGDNIEGKKINLKRVKIGGKTLYNVKASIIYSSTAPLLLGQSVMNRFEEITLDYKTGTVYLGEPEKYTILRNTLKESLKTRIQLQNKIDSLEGKITNRENTIALYSDVKPANVSFKKCNNYYLQGKFQKCVDCYTILIDRNSINPVYYHNRARAKRYIKDYSGAFQDEQIAKEIEIEIERVRN